MTGGDAETDLEQLRTRWRERARDFDSKPGETADQYVERCAGLADANVYVPDVLREKFGFGEAAAKKRFLADRGFWESFFTKRFEARPRMKRSVARAFMTSRVDWPEDEIEAFLDRFESFRRLK